MIHQVLLLLDSIRSLFMVAVAYPADAPTRKKRLIIFVTVTAIVVVAAVVGGGLGGRTETILVANELSVASTVAPFPSRY